LHIVHHIITVALDHSHSIGLAAMLRWTSMYPTDWYPVG
jgi:hypothetical protein